MAYFRKRGDHWEYRIKYNDAGKQKEISKGGFRTKAEARTAAVLIEEKLVVGGIEKLRKGEMLFEDWLEIHNKMHNQHRRESSNISARNGQLKLLDRFKGHKLNKLKRADYQLFINELLFEHDYAKNTVDRIHGEMMGIINSAVEHDELEKNLLRGIQITKDDEEEKTMFLNKFEVKKLLNAIETEDIYKRVMVITLLHTGLRSGELLGLFWSDIDFVNKTLTVDRQRTRTGLGPPKSKSSLRTISIEDDLINELQLYKSWQEENEKIKQDYFLSEYVFVDENGKIFYQTKPQDMMQNLLRYAKLEPRKSTHLLRHTHAVMMLEAGVDIKTVSTRLGHKNIDITANTYLHITPEHERSALKKFEEYLKN
ncbi:site-specific integrase [Lysinibacillus sp. CD3-6]|uniref:tyrosine-type recombinase/integrase n=1 Tax=Lysinibacillus sp. CD3-6 TaxID=2892541 RepID=UPI0011741CD8|nr:site-specific integrase [Lysinibacillus sp. CD3-6]UED81040.1 site-specific integrase [Lysinibacillus sp. CD3-6]